VRVLLHAGLNKTGTTYVQSTWLRTFAEPQESVWYPTPEDSGPGHAQIGWWIRDRRNPPTPVRPLPGVIREAQRRGVSVLLLNTEALSGLREEQAQRLHVPLIEHEVTVLLTLTPPSHRWPSVWQERVKHGWSTSQAESRNWVTKGAGLLPGRLPSLITTYSKYEVLIRLVRPTPMERNLPADLLRIARVPFDQDVMVPGAELNQSIGHAEAHLLRALNELHPGGAATGAGRILLDALQSHQLWRERVPFRKVEVDEALRPYVSDLAHREAETLTSLSDRGMVQLVDPHRLLSRWWEPDSFG
jgi:hypothetical protein